ncbi:MAG: hypothetical protein JWM78_2198 [Verrucomicrobiaceae bacterium]|nr:hypothetical protein [Verrucomicrobiaceae bacterium]
MGRNHTAGYTQWSIDFNQVMAFKNNLKKAFPIYVLMALITGCAQSPYDRAFTNREYKIVEQSAYFKHFVIEHFVAQHIVTGPSLSEQRDELHIYIEGDGSPWIGDQPARDPTPSNPLALELMYQDSSAAIYLGRPCYFNHYAIGADPHCATSDWTNARYSQQIIDDIRTVATRYIVEKNPRRVVLIGYSGGGTIATLIACALPKPVTLITVAANLDTEQWTALHNFSPLSLSLNPVDVFKPCADLTQHHFAGANDNNVPVAITKTFTDRFNAPLIILKGVDHTCCWVALWSQLLSSVLARHKQ